MQEESYLPNSKNSKKITTLDKIVVNQCRGNKHSEGDLSSYSGEYYFGVSGSNGLAQYVSTEYLDVSALWLE